MRRRGNGVAVVGVVASLALVSLVASGQAEAQVRGLEEALDDPSVEAALDAVERAREESANFLVRIGSIPSPSGGELERAEEVARRMEEIGLRDVRVDGSPNAVGVIPGGSGRALVFVSTLDDLPAVSEHQAAADGPPRVVGDRVEGPGVNTASTVAAMIAGARALVESGVTPHHDLVFAAVAEEESGLRGMRALYEELGDRAVAYVDILGDGRSISYGALGIHWWQVRAEGPPGHSLQGGLPNVNQAIARAVDRIFDLPHPAETADRRTVLNIAILESGQVFNHKPASGWFSLDLRSLDGEILEAMEEEVEAILDRVADETGIELTMEPHHLIPGGQIAGARESDLVRTSAAIARHMGLEGPELGEAGSSNMNVAIAGGTPAIALGGGRGGDRATSDEWADVPTLLRMAKHVVLLAATMGGAGGH